MGHSPSKEKAGDGDSLQSFSEENSPRLRGSIRSRIPGARSIGRFQGYNSESDSSDGQINKLTGTRHKLSGSASKPGQLQLRPPQWLSSSLKRNPNDFDEIHHVSDMAPSPSVPAGRAQKVGRSILIKRENQPSPALYSIPNTPLEMAGFAHIDTGVPGVRTLDAMISRLLDVEYSSRSTKTVCLRNAEISAICSASQEILLSQPVLLELSSPVKIVGDIHGQYTDLIRLFEMCGFPPASDYLFLGNYVNRGKQSLETILLLLCYKLKYPENVYLLRGNHECANTTRVFGFYEECKRRCNLKIWESIIGTFNCLPVASIISEKIFCVHGGLSPSLTHIDDIRRIARPTDIPDDGLLNDLLWSDPTDTDEDWEPNKRGVSYTFGKKVIINFLQRHDFDLICRGHMMVDDGYEFFQDQILVTLFSAPNYCGEFNNWGAIMTVSDVLTCSFKHLKPLESTANKTQTKKERNQRNSISNSPVYRHDQSDLIKLTNDIQNGMVKSDYKQGIHKVAPSNQITTTGTSDMSLLNVSRAIDARTSLSDLPDFSQLDLASDLFKATLSVFIMITQRAAKTEHSRRLRSELERLLLWEDAISISDSQLEEDFSESSDLRQTVLATLYELGKVVNDNLIRAVDGITRSEESNGFAESFLTDLTQSNMAQKLQKLLKKAAPVRVVPETTTDVESPSDGESMRYDLDEILDDVATYIDCLMDLSLALEEPIVDIEPFGLQWTDG
ncbi:hypothetical protein N7451_002443 [Penicillium sp. IBT 35674x]|nr:hypothetical protein N7451_002443 [Penicillium sp. IBT 35674x]